MGSPKTTEERVTALEREVKHSATRYRYHLEVVAMSALRLRKHMDEMSAEGWRLHTFAVDPGGQWLVWERVD